MCTLIILNQVSAEVPVVVAANRDESKSRRSLPPRILSTEPRCLAGVDRARGGSWMGATAEGLFVGITNQRDGPLDTSLRSRGEIVTTALRAGSIEGVKEYLAGLDARSYNAFNLLFGTSEALFVAYGRREQREVQIEPVPRGVHVLPNDRLDSPAFPKTLRARRLVEPLVSMPWSRMERRLARVLGDHRQPLRVDRNLPGGVVLPLSLARRLQALCIHLPGYGTVSSTICALGEGRVHSYLYADGAPCRTAFREYTSLLYPDDYEGLNLSRYDLPSWESLDG